MNRYRPKIKFTKNLTSNLFRIFEFIFGRKVGIKIESTGYTSVDKYGNKTEYVIAYSTEAKLAFFEEYVKLSFVNLLKKITKTKINFTFPDFSSFFNVYTPELAYVGISYVPKTETRPSGYMFAIANTNSAIGNSGGGTSTLTLSAYTITGSDICLTVSVANQGSRSGGSTISGVTANGTSMTNIDTVDVPNNQANSFWGLYGAATGNIVITRATELSDGMYASASSYSGVSSSTAIGSLVKTKVSNPGVNFTATVTTLVDNCWLVLGQYSNTSPTAGSGTFKRTNNVISFIFDSNAAITPAGSASLSITGANSLANGYVMVALEPVTASGTHIKSADGVLYANIKSADGAAVANIKSASGVANA